MYPHLSFNTQKINAKETNFPVCLRRQRKAKLEGHLGCREESVNRLHTQAALRPVPCTQVTPGLGNSGLPVLLSSRTGKRVLGGSACLEPSSSTFFSLQQFLSLYLENKAQDLEGLNASNTLAVHGPSFLLSGQSTTISDASSWDPHPQCKARNIQL